MIRWLHKAPLRLRSLFRQNRVKKELNDELRFHLEMLTEENISKGKSPKEAHEAAMRELGGLDQFKEECRDARGTRFIETLLQDLRYGLRMLGRNPGFAITIIFIFAMGIGSSSTIFSVMDGLFLRPLPARNPDELVWFHIGREGYHGPSLPVSYPDYLDICRQSTAFSAIIASARSEIPINTATQPKVITIELVSDNYFSVLGIPAALGRTFLPGENWSRFQAPPVILGYGLWQRQFGADPGIVGKEIVLSEKKAVVLGVAPSWYTKFHKGMSTEMWFPLNAWLGEKNLQNREFRMNLELLGRLRPGIDVAQARVEMDMVAHRFSESFPLAYKGLDFSLTNERDERTKNIFLVSLLMLGVWMVVIICCANISGMMLARAEARQSEIAVRMALGAGRGRLLRQLLTESLILAFLGGAMGLLFTFWLHHLQSRLMPAGVFVINYDFRVDVRVIIFSSAITVITALVTGLAPALKASKLDLVSTLKREQKGARIGRVWLGGRRILLVGQMALSLILVVGAGIFLKSLVMGEMVDPGFDTAKNLLNMGVRLSVKGESAYQGVFVPATEKIRSIPGVKNVSYATGMLDASGEGKGIEVSIPGAEPPSGKKGFEIGYNVIGPNYFQTIGKRLLKGHFFEAERGIGQQDVIINKTMAEQFWPGSDPIGKLIKVGSRNFQIIGVAQDGRSFKDLHKEPSPFIYFPFTGPPIGGGFWVIETSEDPMRLADAIKRQILSMDKGATFVMVETAEEAVGRALWGDRMLFLFIGALGCIGIFLTAVGLYGVVAYLMQRRTQEIGIRLALGACRRDVIRLGVRQGLTIAWIGILVGLGPAIIIVGVLSKVKAGMRSIDPVILLGSCIFVTCVTLLASYLPARRAAKVDPMKALRYE